jgi:hypothetical protein
MGGDSTSFPPEINLRKYPELVLLSRILENANFQIENAKIFILNGFIMKILNWKN